jgi:hypothetical protein
MLHVHHLGIYYSTIPADVKFKTEKIFLLARSWIERGTECENASDASNILGLRRWDLPLTDQAELRKTARSKARGLPRGSAPLGSAD